MAFNEQELTGFIMDHKPVYDWHRKPVGTISDLRRDPKTNAPRHVVVNLNQEARSRLGITDEALEIPISYVFGIRKDAVSLDRSLNELKRLQMVASVLKA